MAPHLTEIIVELSDLDQHLVEDDQVCLTVDCGTLSKDGLYYATDPLVEEIQTTWPSIFASLHFLQERILHLLFLYLSLDSICVSAGIGLEVFIEERVL